MTNFDPDQFMREVLAEAGVTPEAKRTEGGKQPKPKANGNGNDAPDKTPAPNPGEAQPSCETIVPEQGMPLLDDILAFVSRFIIYPSEHARTAHVLWIAHTHLMGVWDSTPRIAFLSPEPASGKSRAIEVSELLVPSPVEAVNVSPAYLFRKVGGPEGPPTILYDEIDTVFGPKAKENEEIRGLLNAGHRRGAVAGRCVVKGNTVETEEIPAYCAVALAGLGWLPDTILSRSIIVRMRKRKPGEKVEPFRRRVYEKQGHALRDRLSRWAASVEPRLTDAWPDMPPGIEDRNADVWEPLLAVADAAGGSWPDRAREAAVTLVTSAREIEPSLGIRLLTDLQTVFGKAAEMPTESILRELHSLKESPWNDLRGKPLNDRGLAQRLRQYEVRPTVLAGGAQRGYRREDLHDSWERYLPLSLPDRSVTSVTDSGVTHVTDVTLVAGDERGMPVAKNGHAPLGGVASARVRVVEICPQPETCDHCKGEAEPGNPLLEVFIGGHEFHLHRSCIEQENADDILKSSVQGYENIFHAAFKPKARQ